LTGSGSSPARGMTTRGRHLRQLVTYLTDYVAD